MPGSGKGVMLWRMTLSGKVRPLLVAVAFVVSLAPLQAQDTAAKALLINGDVSVLRDGGPWALFEGNTDRPQQIVKTGQDGYARFQVFDGSTFEVFPNSQVMFRDNPPSWKDLLDVVIGKVKVYIQHLPGVPNFNNVSSPTAVISVRGTVFEVNVEDVDGTTLVSVDEGLVEVFSKSPGGGGVLLQPTQSIRVFKNQPLAHKMDKSGIARVIERAIQDAARVALQRQTGGGGGVGTPTSTGSRRTACALISCKITPISQSGSSPAGCCCACNAAAHANRINPRRARYIAVFNLSREGIAYGESHGVEPDRAKEHSPRRKPWERANDQKAPERGGRVGPERLTPLRG